MKLFVILVLLPVFGWGQTTEWSNEDTSYTLTSDSPISADSIATAKSTPMHQTARVELSGPSAVNTTTEDPLLSLILRKILENSLNEIEPESNASSKTSPHVVKKPLVYMTPPPPLPNSEVVDDSKNDEEIDISTVAPEDFTTPDSSESAEEEPITESNVAEQDASPAPIPQQKTQYAQQYQKYIPQHFPEDKEVMSPNNDDNNSQEKQENDDSTDDYVPSTPTPSPNGMDKIIFKDAPQTEQLSEQDEIEDQNPQGQSSTEEQDGPLPQRITRPAVYYVFLRPRSQPQSYQPYQMNSIGMMPPLPYSNYNGNSWKMYPERLPQEPQQMFGQNYNNYYQTQSYQQQRPYYQNQYNPYLQQAIRNMMMQMTYNPNIYHNQMQMYPGRQSYPQQSLSYENYAGQQQNWYPSGTTMYNRPYSYYDSYSNYPTANGRSMNMDNMLIAPPRVF